MTPEDIREHVANLEIRNELLRDMNKKLYSKIKLQADVVDQSRKLSDILHELEGGGVVLNIPQDKVWSDYTEAIMRYDEGK